MLIFVIVSCPQAQGTSLCMYYVICIIISVNVFYFVFSAVFIGEGQNLTKYFTFWLYVLICLFWFQIIKYNWKFKCICICILSYYTYSGTEYSDVLNIEYLSAKHVYLDFYTICITPGGCFVHPLGVVTLLDHPIEVFPNICFISGLKVQ